MRQPPCQLQAKILQRERFRQAEFLRKNFNAVGAAEMTARATQ
jgi:hypothetical protein